jgi:hypothetical protein
LNPSLGTTISETPALRATVVVVPLLALGLVLAANISNSIVIVGFLLVVVSFVLVAAVSRTARTEAAILGFLLMGYLIGTRGFAQLSIVPPLFVGEVGLAFCLFFLIGRLAISRKFGALKISISRWIAAFFVLATARFIYDYPIYGIHALRDFAIVYYCLFYFIAFELGSDRSSRQFLNRCLTLGFVCQVIVAFLAEFSPELLLKVRIGHIPILFQKGDLTATFSVIGLYIVYLRDKVVGSRWVRRALLLALLFTIAYSIARGAIVALFLVSPFIWLAGRRTFFGYFGLALIAGVLVFSVATIAGVKSAANSELGIFRDKFVSIFDVGDKAQYASELGEAKADNNEFREAFWKTVTTRTTKDNAILGEGFGYDFLPEFERTYGRGSWEGTRSPHNYFVTIYGRLGLCGLLLLLVIVYLMLRNTLRAATLVRKRALDAEVLGFWCATWVLLISGTFGVVLEGPMGGILFWSFLGLAASGMALREPTAPPARAKTLPAQTALAR